MERVQLFNFYKNVQKSWELYAVTLDQIFIHIKDFNEAFSVSHLDKYINEETHPLHNILHDDKMYFWEHGEQVEFDYKKELVPYPPKEYNDRKLSLPCVVFNSYSKKGHRKKAESQPTQLIYLDIDQIYDQTYIPYIKSELVERFPFIKACWVSVSGYGLGFIAQCSGVTLSNYDIGFDQLKELIEIEYLSSINLEIDPQSKGFSQPSILPYDPAIIINDCPDTFLIRNDATIKGQKVTNESTFSMDDYALPNKDEVLNSILKTKETYYSLYRRYIKDLSNDELLLEAIEGHYHLEQVDYATYSTLCGNKSHIYDAGEKLPITYRIYFDSKILEGKRTKLVGTLGMKLIFNNPFTKPELLLKHLYAFNKNRFDPPLKPKEVYNSFIYNYKKYLSGELDFSSIIRKHTYGIFHRDADKERENIDVARMKQKLGTSVYHKNHNYEQIDKVLNARYSLKEKGIKETQHNLCKESGIKSRKTIRKYLQLIDS